MSTPLVSDPEQLGDLSFDAAGLIPAVVQEHASGEIRMLAWMNREALEQTIASGYAVFFSRSRQRLWLKGETSGNRLRVSAIVTDCDRDALVLRVQPDGPTCHTGAESCFFRELAHDLAPEAELAPDESRARSFLFDLEATLARRARSTAGRSYTRSLLDAGAPKVGAKLREEAGELAQALAAETDERVVSEAADVLYHLLVGLRLRDVPLRAVMAELARRTGRSGHEEKASRGGARGS